MEIGCRLGLAAKKRYPNHVMGGWVYCSLHASIASAILSARIFGLSRQQMRSAIGISYHQAAGNGLAAFDGTDVRVLGPGFAARNGILSATLSGLGITGTQNSIDSSELSLMNLYHNGVSPGFLSEDLGVKYYLLNTGFKIYPCCGLGHRYLDAVSKLINKYLIPVHLITKIMLKVPAVVFNQLCSGASSKPPYSISTAQFNLKWQVACVVCKGKLSLHDFEIQSMLSDNILEMMDKIVIELDETLKSEQDPADIIISVRSQEYHIKTCARYGSPENPLSDQQMQSKLFDCVEFGQQLTAKNSALLYDYISSIENESDLTGLYSILPHN